MVAQQSPSGGHPSLRALLIDCNLTDRDHLADELRACDPRLALAVAESVQQALDHLDHATQLPQVIFADLHLRDHPATELLLWIRSLPEFAPVWLIALTRDLRFATIAPRGHGADALLVKPVSRTDLAAVLALAATRKLR